MIEGRLRLYKESLAARKETHPAETVTKAYIEFEQWEGSRRHPHLVEKSAYALIIGSVAYTEDGRKDLNGSHILSVKKFERAPRGTANEFAKIHLPKKYQK